MMENGYANIVEFNGVYFRLPTFANILALVRMRTHVENHLGRNFA